MPTFDGSKTLWTYTTDNNAAIMYRADTGYTTQAGLGGAAWSGAPTSSKRLGLKIRRAIAVGDVTAIVRSLPVFTLAAYDAIVPGTTKFNVRDETNQVEAATVRSLEGERHRGGGIKG